MPDQAANVLGQETETRLLAALLPHTRKTFVDVGAERGALARFLVDQGLRGTLFEPLPKHQETLTALAAATGVRYLNFAVDQQDGKAEFHIACDDTGKPLDFFHSLQPLKDDPRVHHRQTVPVVCRSLASLHAEGLVERELGVLKIDTEGNDLRVLRGLGPVRADVVLCEFFTKGIYNGWTEAEPLGLIQFARQLGYHHWVAVRRRGPAELLSLNSLDFTEKEWGNLIFIAEPVFQAGWTAVSRVIAGSDDKLFSQLENGSKSKRRRWLRW
ncbi:MAG: hypothetical protein JWR69_2510 [Pedosphaera sp.]|nr:hypothetical protein [Pedosphaera sp.]